MIQKNALGKHGLTGNSGFVGSVHLHANYDAGTKVFITSMHKEYGLIWRRVTMKQASRMKVDRIVRCEIRRCGRPAVTIPHCFPYIIEGCRCEKHANYKSRARQ